MYIYCMADRGRPRRTNCVKCGRHIDECGPLSRTRQCNDCGSIALRTNITELANHSGDTLKRWRARTILSAGGILPDDLKEFGEK